MLKGTAGSLVNAFRKNEIDVNDKFLIYYGDILTDMNLNDFQRYHEFKHALITVALASSFTIRVGLADLDEEGRIKKFVEKPAIERPVSIGLLIMDGKVLGETERLIKNDHHLDLMQDVIPYFVKIEKSIYGYLSDAFWYDTGSIEAYEKLDHHLVDKKFSYLFPHTQ